MKIIKKLKLNRGHLIGTAALAATIIMPEMAIAADDSTALAPVYNKITEAMKGTFGKVMAGVSFALAAMASIAGMNKAAILTPIGFGLFITQSSNVIEWIFPNT